MRPRIDPVILPRLVFWALLVGLLWYTVADPDLWGHVRFGENILSQRAIETADPYSFTSDRPWVNHEWLSEAVMAASYVTAGAVGLAILKFTLLLAAFALLARELAARGVPPVARDVLVAICVVSCLTLTRTLRPQTFSLLLFGLLLSTLRRVEGRRVTLIWWLPLLMMLWANLHGGWLVGIAVIGIWTAIRCVAPRGASRAVWAAAALASVIATLLTPEGTGLWSFLWDTVGLGRADISEWQSLTGRSPGDALPWLLTTVVAVIGIVHARDRQFAHIAVVAVLLVLSFKVWRLAPFYAFAGIFLLGPQTVRSSERPGSPAAASGPWALVIVGLMALLAATAAGVTSYRNLTCIAMSGDWIADREAAAFIQRSGLSGRMLTWFDWGEYAIWFLPEIKVSMDGRRETVYSDEVLRRHYAVYRGAVGWENDLRQINPEHIWLPVSVPTLTEIERLGWRRVLRTDQSAVLSRGDVRPVTSATTIPAPCFPGEP